jgi:hypothetical protein
MKLGDSFEGFEIPGPDGYHKKQIPTPTRVGRHQGVFSLYLLTYPHSNDFHSLSILGFAQAQI